MTFYQEIGCPNAVAATKSQSPVEQSEGCSITDANAGCLTKTFLLDSRYKDSVAGVKRQVMERAINGSGIRI